MTELRILPVPVPRHYRQQRLRRRPTMADPKPFRILFAEIQPMLPFAPLKTSGVEPET